MTDAFLIFGKHVQIEFLEGESGKRLHSELSLYPKSENNTIDLRINYLEEVTLSEKGWRNPSLQVATENELTIVQPNCVVKFYFGDNDLKQIDFAIPAKKKRFLNRNINRWMSMQFTSNEEAIGQIFHEQVLVPSLFFDPTRALLHASAVQLPNGPTIAIGGTGGIGKTSIEMELCLNHQGSFITDDIAVIDGNAQISPNLAYPKIYGYNLQGNAGLKKKLLKGSSVSRRLHWQLHQLRGANFVRQRVSPELVYGQVTRLDTSLDAYYIFKREYREDIVSQKINADEAARLSRLVMAAEYNEFLRHLLWYEFNQGDAAPGFESSLHNMETLMKQALEHVDCHVIRIPVNIDHDLFKSKMVEILVPN